MYRYFAERKWKNKQRPAKQDLGQIRVEAETEIGVDHHHDHFVETAVAIVPVVDEIGIEPEVATEDEIVREKGKETGSARLVKLVTEQIFEQGSALG